MARKLSRKKPNREHMIKNLAASLVLYEYIDTTEAKAKEVKNYVEKIFARTKANGLSEKRTIFQSFFGKSAAQKTINELLPRYEGRNSGFTRTFRLKNRLGDNAEMLRIELIDRIKVDKAVLKSDEVAAVEEKPKTASKAKAEKNTTTTVKTKKDTEKK